MPITHPTREELSGEMQRLGELRVDDRSEATTRILETLNTELDRKRGAVDIVKRNVPQLVGNLLPDGLHRVNRPDFLRWLEQNLTTV